MTGMRSENSDVRQLRSLMHGYTTALVSSCFRQDMLFRDLFDNFRATFRNWQKSEKTAASGFNLLDTLQISNDEVRHSMMLAWLLDHRIERAGTHAQGSLGFRLFLDELELNSRYSQRQYWVSREVCGSSSRVDIEIAAPSDFIIHIENKIYSEEGPDQSDREWADLLRRAFEIRVKRNRIHAIFLTLDGTQPLNKNFVAISWRQIAKVLDRFADKAKAPEVKTLAAHYARALRNMTLENVEANEDEDSSHT